MKKINKKLILMNINNNIATLYYNMIIAKQKEYNKYIIYH